MKIGTLLVTSYLVGATLFAAVAEAEKTGDDRIGTTPGEVKNHTNHDYAGELRGSALDEIALYSVSKNMNSPMNALRDPSGIDGLLLGSALVPTMEDPNSWCNKGDSDCERKLKEDLPIQFLPGSKSYGTTNLSPVGEYKGILNSMAYANLTNSSLTSANAVMRVSMAVTEPGIQAGTNSAEIFSNAALQQRYGADRLVRDSAMANPEAGAAAIGLYQNCIHSLQNPFTTDATGKRVPLPGKSFTESQSICLGGDKIGEGFAEFSTGSAMNFNYDPSHASKSPEVMGATKLNVAKEDNQITLHDLLFNQSIITNPKVLKGGEDPKHSLLRLRKSFEKYIGNIKKTWEVGAITIERIPPELSPGEATKLFTLQAYYNLASLLEIRCFQYSGSTAQGPNADVFTPFTDPDTEGKMRKSDFWANSIGGEENATATTNMIEASMAGYALKPQLVDAFFDMFRYDEDEVGHINCFKFSSGRRGGVSEIFLPNVNIGGSSLVKARSRMLMKYSEHIGRGRYLSILMKAVGVVDHLSGGQIPSDMSKEFDSLIMQAAGTDDIMREYRENLAAVSAYEREIFLLRDGTRKQRGVSLAALSKVGGRE